MAFSAKAREAAAATRAAKKVSAGGTGTAVSDTVLAALESMKAELAALRSENERLAAKAPQFVKMKPVATRRERTYIPPDALRAQATKKLRKGEDTSGATRWWDTPQGRSTLPPEYRPVFAPGDPVRINPETLVFGGPVALKDGKNQVVGHAQTWGELLDHLGMEGAGEVIGCMGITDTFEPKYKCAIPGLSSGFGGGWRESELLPLEETA